MADRKKLQEELNKINELYQQYDLDLRKAGGSTEQRQQMRDMMNAKKLELEAELGDDLHKLNRGKGINIANSNPAIDTKGLKKVGKPMLKNLGKIIPGVGAVMALAQGDPAMAAEELAYDAAGPLEALRPESAGNVEEERELIAERNAQQKYNRSQAGQDARIARGESAEYKRPPIGRNQFEATTGTSLKKVDDAQNLENEIETVKDDEKKLNKLKQMLKLSGQL